MKMTDEQVFAVAAVANLLSEFGYESVADVVGRISEQEIVLQYQDVTRLPFAVVQFDSLVEAAKRIVAATESDTAITRALVDLLAGIKPDERDKIAAYLTRSN